MSERAADGQMDIEVRYSETDSMGYLHHSRYLVYFEMGRMELLRRRGIDYRLMEERGFFYVVARLECKYRAPARYGEILTLTTTVGRMTPVRIEHNYRLTHGAVLVAEANSTIAAVGCDGRPVALPNDLWAQIGGVAGGGVAR